MRKLTILKLIMLIIILNLFFFDTANSGLVQASTSKKGIINSDTVWTKENSPYTLTGTILVNNGVTLTIESGVVVNLNGYLLQVNGTLVARGSSTDSIQLNDGRITFQYSTAWNEQENSGTIIENTIMNSIHIDIRGSLDKRGSLVKINNNIIDGGLIQSQISDGDPSLYSANEEFTAIISNNHIVGGSYSSIIEALNTDIIFNNTIICTPMQRIGINAQYYSSVISNTITGVKGYGIMGGKNISGNVVSGFEVGIMAGYATVMNNWVFNNVHGIEIGGLGSIVKNNTIANNAIGVYLAQGYFNYNNFEDNSEYNMYVFSKSDVNATHNWWGTTDASVIDQKIWDYTDDFSLGKVNYMPILTMHNSQATSNASLSSLTSQSLHSSSTLPNQSNNNLASQSSSNWAHIAITVLLTVVTALLITNLLYMRRKHKANTSVV